MSILLSVASLTGNTKTIIDFIKENCTDDIVVCEDFSVSPEEYDKIILGSYSWGNGKIPRRMKKYLIDNQQYFKDKNVFIYGSGNSIYPRFCGAADGIEKIVSDCGANIIGKFKYEQRFNKDDFSEEELTEVINQLNILEESKC